VSTFAEIVARTAAAKASGRVRTYPEHRGKAKKVERTAAPVAGPKPHVQQNKPCAYRGKEPIRSETCGSCRKRTQLKVFACAVFGDCTPETPHAKVKGCCKGCTRYQTQDATTSHM
jgi:hypothetical protein